jgi:AraC-like DNA-binding protein
LPESSPVKYSTLPAPSIFGGMAIVVYQTLNSYDVSADEIFARFGISTSNLNSTDTRIDTADWHRLILECIKVTGDSNFIFKTADFIQPTCFHAMGLALFSSRSIRKFLIRLERYSSFLTTTEEWIFNDSETDPELVVISNRAPEKQSEVLLYGTVIWLDKMISLMYGPHFRAACLNIPGSQPDKKFLSKLEEFFDCPIEFEQEHFSIIFKPQDLDFQLPSANAALARQNDEVILEVLSRIAKADVPMRMRLKLMELLPTGDYSKEVVARELCFSVRTLHNKLAESGTSYQEILDQTRRELAEQYLRQDNMSVGDVAFLLGFSDFSNLSRAFKKWTGKTPTQYREQALGLSE